MAIDGSAFIAFKSRDKSWLNTGSSVDYRTFLPYQQSATAADAEDKDGPPLPDADKFYYTPVWDFEAEVKREYGGINSSGGPQVSGRADQTDFSLELQTSAASPVVYEHCCSGKQFEWVHVVVCKWSNGQPTKWMHIRMADVNVTGYEFNGVRWFQDNFETAAVGGLTAATALTHTGVSTYALGHYDDVTLLYTKIAFNYFPNTERGWDTGSDAPWTP